MVDANTILVVGGLAVAGLAVFFLLGPQIGGGSGNTGPQLTLAPSFGFSPAFTLAPSLSLNLSPSLTFNTATPFSTQNIGPAGGSQTNPAGGTFLDYVKKTVVDPAGQMGGNLFGSQVPNYLSQPINTGIAYTGVVDNWYSNALKVFIGR